MDLVTVHVRLYGELSCYGKVTHHTGKYSTIDVKLSVGSTLKDLLDYLLMCTNERGFTFINGLISAIPNHQMDLNHVLNDGDQILFFPYKMLPTALQFDLYSLYE